ncbi:MAG: [FeFe] hydrogenase H-cluster radical SAM maturase HydE [Clostridia bacterium]|nr:[FeFe] hydrogenase H-cluster radical SAM maturase HydE [Clostridia bacterium]
MNFSDIINRLKLNRDLPDGELKFLISSDEANEQLALAADEIRRANYGEDVYIRGLIEFSNYCKNNCYYCGIRCGNTKAVRYRLTKADIMECCAQGYSLGFRTFVLQGGEDPHFTDEVMCDIIAEIRQNYPDCAITLSVGERSRESYQAYFNAGANRFLLRHETATDDHYRRLHPKNLSLQNRKQCLFDLKEIGFQVGSGFMVGSPYQSDDNLLADLRFLQTLQPDMIGIGPFIRHEDTPFATFDSGDLYKTLRLVSILRLMFPYALIPSTTALGTIHPQGREMGLRAGANVVMPNLSPKRVRELYMLYDNKISTDEEAAESVDKLKKKVVSAGYRVVTARGDVKKEN